MNRLQRRVSAGLTLASTVKKVRDTPPRRGIKGATAGFVAFTIWHKKGTADESMTSACLLTQDAMLFGSHSMRTKAPLQDILNRSAFPEHDIMYCTCRKCWRRSPIYSQVLTQSILFLRPWNFVLQAFLHRSFTNMQNSCMPTRNIEPGKHNYVHCHADGL